MPLWIALYVVTGMRLQLGRWSKGAALLVVVGVRVVGDRLPVRLVRGLGLGAWVVGICLDG